MAKPKKSSKAPTTAKPKKSHNAPKIEKPKKSPKAAAIEAPKRSLSALISIDREERILRAMARSRVEPKTSLRQISKEAGLAHSTLVGRLHGSQSRSAAMEKHQTLSKDEESRLASVLLFQAKMGVAANKEQLYCFVDQLIDQRYSGDEGNPVTTTKKPTKNAITGHYVSKNWVVGFLKRNPSIMMKSASKDAPPPKDNLLELDKEFERGFSDKEEVREFYRKLAILTTKKSETPQYAEIHAKCLILMERATIRSIATIRHPELFEKKMEQLSEGRKRKANESEKTQ